MPFLPSASCRNLDLPPVNLRFLQSHLTKNAFAIAPTHSCGIALELYCIIFPEQNCMPARSNQIISRPNRMDCWWQNVLSTVPDTARFLPPPGQLPAVRTASASAQNSLRAVLISFLPSRRTHRHKGGNCSMKFGIFALWFGFQGIWQAAFPESTHTADRQLDAGQRKKSIL